MRRLLVTVVCCTFAFGGLAYAAGTHAQVAPTALADVAPTGVTDTLPVGAPDGSFDPAGRGTTSQVATTQPPPSTGSGRRAVYSKTQQRVWVIDENDHLVREFLISGRLDMPKPGTYKVWSKSAYTCSVDRPSECMRFMIRFAKGLHGGNIGFHEIPVWHGAPVQTYDQLGQPISDGCLRETTDDAIFMWNWAPVGTTVVVIA